MHQGARGLHLRQPVGAGGGIKGREKAFASALFSPLHGFSRAPLVFRRLKIRLKEAVKGCEGTGRARVSSPGPLFVCQEFSEKDPSTSGDRGA